MAKPIPCLIGFGGLTPAGRGSHNLSYSRMIYDLESDQNKFNYLKSVLTLCGLIDETTEAPEIEQLIQSKENEVLENTLMRKLDYEFFRNTFWSYDYEMPANACGQLPFRLDPVTHYASRQHPKALGMSIVGFTDAMSDAGLDLRKEIDTYGRDKVGCFAGCAVMNMDRYSGDGLFASYPMGKRASSKHISFTLPEMTADFINAYVTGSLGITGHFIGACATSLYNLNAGVELIKSGKSELVIVGAAEAILGPPAYIGFSAMGAMATDERMTNLQKLLGEGDDLDYTKFCRPFGDNMGMVCGESAGFAILMSDRLALEVGANIRGCFLNVNINADGNKKSISGPGAGNYFSVGKTFKDIETIFGSKTLQEKSCFLAHGTGTPLNRITESHIISTFAKEFGIKNLPVTSVKSKLGHTMGTAGMDQIWCGLGALENQKLTGICTIPKLADDVFKENLDFFLENKEFDSQKDIAFLNSKGFGGNNATSALISSNLTEELLRRRFTEKELKTWKKKREATLKLREKNFDLAVNSEIEPIYDFDKDVLDLTDLEISKKNIKTKTGFNYALNSDLTKSDF
uniref:Putative beta-ketoacyl synthase, C-terminal domain protein n=1 Tax=uncultured bacterium EIL27G07 TaxID=1768202 RepID=A0A0U2M5V6_9BACT|nr:putative beta-ketoacyl synthase, C-terminal domain protein [uncultured bacterium EIL27G07]